MDLFEWEEQTRREEEEQKQNEKQMKLAEMMKQVNLKFGKGSLEKGLHQGAEIAEG